MRKEFQCNAHNLHTQLYVIKMNLSIFILIDYIPEPQPKILTRNNVKLFLRFSRKTTLKVKTEKDIFLCNHM